MEVSVLTLRDLASGRPGRRGRAEAAQKVSGEGGRGVLAPSNVNPVLPVRSTARVRGQREDRGGGGQPGPQRVCPPPPPFPPGGGCWGAEPWPGGLGGLEAGWAGVCPPDRVPLSPHGSVWGAAHGNRATGLSSSILPVGTWSTGVSDATLTIKRQCPTLPLR